jgi:hypothetical protein
MRRYSITLPSLLLLAAFISCGHPSYEGSYTFPTAIVGIQLGSSAEAVNLERHVTAFAVAKGLDVYEKSARDPVATPLQKPLAGSEFEYAPDPPNLTHGFSLSLEKLAEGCFIVTFSERSQNWSQQSLDALTELQRVLNQAFPNNVHLLVRPKREQNWPERQRLKYVDEEWPDSFASLCDRMNESPSPTKQTPRATPLPQ